MRSDDAPRHARQGAVLLEVIIGLMILATTGITVLALAGESARAIRHARETDAEYRRASALLEAVALWPREDLDRHLGDRVQGRWRLRVDRAGQTLYGITLTDSLTGVALLRTVLFRPEPIGATP